MAVAHRKLQCMEASKAAWETAPFAAIPSGPAGFDTVFQPGRKPAVFIRATRVAAGQEAPVLIDEKNS